MAFLVAPLRHLPGSAGAEQLEQVVGETDQFPFRSDLLQSAQQEPSKPTPLFDLPKHREVGLTAPEPVRPAPLDPRGTLLSSGRPASVAPPPSTRAQSASPVRAVRRSSPIAGSTGRSPPD